MLEKSWPEISKGLANELEVFSSSDVPVSVNASKLGTHPEKPRYLLPIRFRFVLIIVRFRRSFCHRKQFLIPGLKDETSYIVCFQKRCCYQGYLVLITGGDLEERKQSVV